MSTTATEPRTGSDHDVQRTKRGKRPRNDRRWSGQGVILYIVMLALAVMFLLPLLWMFSSSLKLEADVLKMPPDLWPSEPQWKNYTETLAIIAPFAFNSVKLALFNVVGVMAVASLAGYAFARMEFVGRDALFVVVVATAIVPSIVYLLPQYIVFTHIGWVDTHYPLWAPRVFTPVFATFLMRQYFMTLPRDLEEAAKVDGASTFTTFWRIMLPQTTPALAAIAAFTFLDSWNDLFGPIIFLNSGELQTLPVALAQFQSEYFTEVSVLMAAATMTVLPVLIVFIFAQKYFIQGIAMTGMK
jgi:multiple sugar transport system permease protein